MKLFSHYIKFLFQHLILSHQCGFMQHDIMSWSVFDTLECLLWWFICFCYLLNIFFFVKFSRGKCVFVCLLFVRLSLPNCYSLRLEILNIFRPLFFKSFLTVIFLIFFITIIFFCNRYKRYCQSQC